jgi:hypothetical protein
MGRCVVCFSSAVLDSHGRCYACGMLDEIRVELVVRTDRKGEVTHLAIQFRARGDEESTED